VGEAGGRVARLGPVAETVLGLVAAPAPTNHPRLGGQVLGLRSAGEGACTLPPTSKGAFHVFGEVEAKEAARQCGATVEKNTRGMWESLWKKA
jgi:hypothetical protein